MNAGALHIHNGLIQLCNITFTTAAAGLRKGVAFSGLLHLRSCIRNFLGVLLQFFFLLSDKCLLAKIIFLNQVNVSQLSITVALGGGVKYTQIGNMILGREPFRIQCCHFGTQSLHRIGNFLDRSICFYLIILQCFQHSDCFRLLFFSSHQCATDKSALLSVSLFTVSDAIDFPLGSGSGICNGL